MLPELVSGGGGGQLPDDASLAPMAPVLRAAAGFSASMAAEGGAEAKEAGEEAVRVVVAAGAGLAGEGVVGIVSVPGAGAGGKQLEVETCVEV